MTSTDRRFGYSSAVAVKAPCKVATTANITLSGAQTIDGVSVTAGDRVLVKDQTDAAENGIYIADTAVWSRAPDFNGARDVVHGTIVSVTSGSSAGSFWRVTTSDDPVLIDGDTPSDIDFELASTSGITVSATDKVLGRVSSGSGQVEEVSFTDAAQQLCDDANFAAMRATLGLVIGADVQAYDADLTALAGLSSTGMVARTGSGTAAVRTLTGTASEIDVTNGTGASGNPTISLPSTIDLAAKIVVGGNITPGTCAFKDSTTTFYDEADPLKQMKLEMENVTSGVVRVLSVPDADGTIALASDFLEGFIASGAWTLETTGPGDDISLISSAGFTLSADGEIEISTTGQISIESVSQMNLYSETEIGISADDSIFINTPGVLTLSGGANVVVGEAALAADATEGFLWIPSAPGVLSGAATAPYSGGVALSYDSVNNRIMVRSGGTWRATAALT